MVRGKKISTRKATWQLSPLDRHNNNNTLFLSHCLVLSLFKNSRPIFKLKGRYTHTHTHTYICKKLKCYIKNIRDITMDNKLTTVPDDAATRETNPKKIKCLISPLWVPL